jgi:hypothetical protein
MQKGTQQFDNEIILAEKGAQDMWRRIGEGEFVSQQKITATIVNSGLKQLQRLKDKQNFITDMLVQHGPTNRFAKQGLSEAVGSILESMNMTERVVSDSMEKINAASNTDIRAYQTVESARSEGERVREMKKAGEFEREETAGLAKRRMRVGERQVTEQERSGEFEREETVGLAERRMRVGERQVEEQERSGQDVSLRGWANVSLAREEVEIRKDNARAMSAASAFEQLNETITLVNKWSAGGRNLDDLASALGTDTESLEAMVERADVRDAENRKRSAEVETRISDLTKRSEAGEDVSEDLASAMRRKKFLTEIEDKKWKQADELAYADSLEGLDALAYKVLKNVAGTLNELESKVMVSQPGVSIPRAARRGAAAGANKGPVMEAIKEVY